MGDTTSITYDNEDRDDNNQDSYETVVPRIIGEVTDMREEYTKHFLNDDYSYEAVVYPEPVHYLEDGEWREVDNTLIETDDTSVTSSDVSMAGLTKGNVLKNQANDYEVRFAKNANSNKLVQIKKDGYEISWTVADAKGIQSKLHKPDMKATRNQAIANATAKISEEADLSKLTASKKQEAKEILVDNEMARLAENASSQLTYAGILPDVDLKYKVLSGELKEDIILKRYKEDFKISFQMKVKNLTARLEEDNTISFYDKKDTEKVVFTTEAPFMYDQNDVYSMNISVTLEEVNGGYLMTLIPEDTWLAEEGRSWPVVIDPIIRTKSTMKLIRDTFVSSGYPTTDHHRWDTFRTGYDGIYKQQHGYVKFDLPVLSSSSMVTYAELQLYSRSVLNGGTQVNVHKVKDAWESETINWNNKPGYEDTIIDYKVVDTGDKWYSFDITSIAKDWYSQEINKGLMLKGKSETVGVTEFLSSDYSDSLGRPVVWIRYVDFAGLEDYWTYHSQDVARAGTGYINDYNGNLIFIHNDLNMSGNLMPLSISHIFNSNNRSENAGFGSGWKFNLTQRIVEGSGSGGNNNYDVEDPYAYYYIDGDGTKHYFNGKDSDGAYKDESGLNITLTKNSNGTYTIKDTKDNLLIFRSDGYLSTINDNNGNKIILNYNGTVLTGATDGAGRLTTFTYANGRLSKIKDPAGRETLYEYTGENLTKITYPDNKISRYVYDINGNLTQITNYDGYRITYTYGKGEVKRVTKAAESHTDGTKGGELAITYGFNKTTFTDISGRKDIYHFSDFGNTLSIRDSEGSAQYYEYGTGTMVNKLTSQSLLQNTTVNYVKNHNIEQNSDFTLFSNGGSGTGSYTSESSYLGSRSLKITKTDNQNAQLYYQKFKAEAEKTYTFSAYVRTLDISNTNNMGAYLQAWYTDNAGVIRSVRSEHLSGSNEWTRLETTLTVPSGIIDKTITIRVGIQSETGTAYFDNLQFEEGYVANRYSLVENGDFRDGSLAFWSTTGLEGGDGIIKDSVTQTAPAVLDNNSFKLSGSSQKTKNIKQTIKVSGKAEDIFVISAWAKAASVPLTDSNRKFALKLEFVNNDGTKTPVEFAFNQDSTDWQYVSGKAITEKEYSSVIIYGIYDRNENTTYFDGFRLYKEVFGQSFTYDENGNITSTKDIADKKSEFEYSKNNLIKQTDPKGSSFNYSYDSKHNLTKATTAENVVYSFEYDNKGNPVTSRIEGTDLYIQSNASYTLDKNYVSKIEDADGNTVGYDYNTTKGTLNSVTDVNGSMTDYAYDTMDRLTSVSKDVNGKTITNRYSYEYDRLKSIIHNGFSYNFTYDSLGNNTEVLVGNQSLIKNTFYNLTNNLSQSSYGNNQKVNYYYDSLDRLIEVKVDSNTIDKYHYDAEGNLAYHEDAVNDVSYRYYYDLSDRIAQKKDSKENQTKYSYDSNSNLSRLQQSINGTDYSTKYRYDKDNRPITVAYNQNKNNIHDKLENNLIASYSFDNNDVSDESGNGHDGTLKGGAVFTDGKYGRALKLNGTDAWAELPDFDIPETFSISMWVNPYTTDDEQTFIGKHTADGGNIFLMGNWSGKSHLRIRSAVNTQTSKTTGYQHLVAVVKKISDTSSSVKYYKDNVLIWTSTMNDIIGNASGKGWALGQEWDGAKLSDFLKGEIDEVAFYNKDLSLAEVKELYNTAYGQSRVNYMYDSLGRLNSKQISTGSATLNSEFTYEAGINKDTAGTLGASTTNKVSSINNDGNRISYSYDRNGNISTITDDNTNIQTRYQYNELNELVKEETKESDGLIAYYSFNNSDATDDSGNGNDGTIVGAPEFIPGQRGNAVKLDGIDDYIVLTDFDLPDSFAISMWVNPYTTDTTQYFVSKHTQTGGNIFLAGVHNGKDHLSLRGGTVSSSGPATTGYQHWVINVSKVSETQTRISFFKDNELIREAVVEKTMDNIKGRPWLIGQEWDGDTATDFANAAIDELAFFEHNLTGDEIQDIYTNGITLIKGKTVEYTYDQGGNITLKTENIYNPVTGEAATDTISYEYGDSNWKDKLTSYDGKTITYDEIGNPLTYDGYTYSWQKGRQLAGISGNGITSGYKYNDGGIRTQKAVNGVTTTYHLEGDLVIYEESYNESDSNTKFDKIYYTYTSDGTLVSMNLDGVEYYYIRNAQGDIIGLYDEAGVQVVAYTYDSWGKLVSIKDQNGNDVTDDNNSVGYKNPYRYRGYRYDGETRLFYVVARYYDSEIGRFINADDTDILFEDQDNILEHNLFAYCFNNPVNMHDPDGYAAANIIGGIVGGAAGAALGVLLAKQLGLTGWKKAALIAAATVGGAALGAFLGPYVAKLGSQVAAKLGIQSAKVAVKGVSKFTANKMSHLMRSKHLWGRVLNRVTERGVQDLIRQTITKGTISISSKTGVATAVYKYRGEIIEVTGKIINGIFEVGTAYVKGR
jgi:RHS repeat-associated protein